MSTGSIADTVDRVLLWCRSTPRGMAFVEFQSEPARQRVITALQASLPDEAGPLHELTLAPAPSPIEVVHRLVDELRALDGGVVSLDGFGRLFPPGHPPADLVSAFNFNRERLAQPPLKQVWWMTPRVVDAFRHGAHDLYSWFQGRWNLTEAVPPAEQLELFGKESRTLNLADARRRADDLIERFEQALGQDDAPRDQIERYFLRPAVKVLREAGEERRARELESRFNSTGRYLHLRGRPGEAEPNLLRALRILEDAGDEESHEVAAVLNDLAAHYADQGLYGKAEPLCRRALKILERTLDDHHPDIARALNDLAAIYVDLGRYEEAQPLYQRALRIREEIFGKEHPEVALTLNNLASSYYHQGRYEEALRLYSRAISTLERELGDQHPHVARTLNNLAALSAKQGLYEDAEKLFKRALRIREQTLGNEHVDFAASLGNLASLYANQGRSEDAEPLYQRSLSILERVLGPEHPETRKIHDDIERLRQAR